MYLCKTSCRKLSQAVIIHADHEYQEEVAKNRSFQRNTSSYSIVQMSRIENAQRDFLIFLPKTSCIKLDSFFLHVYFMNISDRNRNPLFICRIWFGASSPERMILFGAVTWPTYSEIKFRNTLPETTYWPVNFLQNKYCAQNVVKLFFNGTLLPLHFRSFSKIIKLLFVLFVFVDLSIFCEKKSHPCVKQEVRRDADRFLHSCITLMIPAWYTRFKNSFTLHAACLTVTA